MKDSRKQLYATVIIALLSLLVSGWVGYSHQHETTDVRLSVIEAKDGDRDRRLERIETKLDEVLRRMQR